MLRLLFAAFDGLILVLIGHLWAGAHGKWLQVFYAFHPLFLMNLVLTPADESIVIALLLLTIAAVGGRQRNSADLGCLPLHATLGGLGVVAFLANFKWIGLAYLPGLAIAMMRTPGRLMAGVGLIVVMTIALNALWFPSWTYVYEFRIGMRELEVASHSSLSRVLGPWLPLWTLLLAQIAVVLALNIAFLAGRLRVGTFVLLSAVPLLALRGDTTGGDLAVATLLVAMVLSMGVWRWTALFVVAMGSAMAYGQAVGAFPRLTEVFGAATWIGRYGSPQMNALVWTPLAALALSYLLIVSQRAMAQDAARTMAGALRGIPPGLKRLGIGVRGSLPRRPE